MGDRNRWRVAIAAALAIAVSSTSAQVQLDRPARGKKRPNFNGIWQALNAAYWNLEGHSAEALKDEFSQLGAIAAIPAGQSVVRGGTIPYKPEALAKRDAYRAAFRTAGGWTWAAPAPHRKT
jgi:hypothetical protein